MIKKFVVVRRLFKTHKLAEHLPACESVSDANLWGSSLFTVVLFISVTLD